MFIADDVLLFPVKSLLFLLREIHNAAIQEIADEGDAIRLALSDLYLQLESNGLSEAEFDARERVLLDRLDELESYGTDDDDDDDDVDADDDDEDDDDDETENDATSDLDDRS